VRLDGSYRQTPAAAGGARTGISSPAAGGMKRVQPFRGCEDGEPVG
jgi:hypothetical protein